MFHTKNAIFKVILMELNYLLTATSRKCEIGESNVLVISSLNKQISQACSELHRPFSTSVTTLAGSYTSPENKEVPRSLVKSA